MDYNYIFIYTSEDIYQGSGTDTYPMLSYPGSFLYFNEKKFVVSYWEPIGDKEKLCYPELKGCDLSVICNEVENDYNEVLRDIKLGSLLTE